MPVSTPPVGAYAEERLIAADRVVKIPDGVDDQTAAAMMLQDARVAGEGEKARAPAKQHFAARIETLAVEVAGAGLP